MFLKGNHSFYRGLSNTHHTCILDGLPASHTHTRDVPRRRQNSDGPEIIGFSGGGISVAVVGVVEKKQMTHFSHTRKQMNESCTTPSHRINSKKQNSVKIQPEGWRKRGKGHKNTATANTELQLLALKANRGYI